MGKRTLAFYIRLSDADEEVKKGIRDESNSIMGQRELLTSFVRNSRCHPSHYKLPHPSNCLGLNVGSDTIPVKFMVPFPSHFGIEEGARHMWL